VAIADDCPAAATIEELLGPRVIRLGSEKLQKNPKKPEFCNLKANFSSKWMKKQAFYCSILVSSVRALRLGALQYRKLLQQTKWM